MTRRHRLVNHDVHVVPTAVVGWEVKQRGRLVSRHRTQRNAMRAGRRLAMRLRVEMVAHGLDGRFRSKDSYGHESEVRDTEH